MMDGALPLSLSWAEAISVPWQSSVKRFNKISIFLPVSPVSYVWKERRIVLYREEKGCNWVVNLVTEAKSYSWVSGERPEMTFQA